jgi:hypothetical protein
MSVPNIQHNPKPDSDIRNHLVGYSELPSGFGNWTPFTRCNKKTVVAKSIQFGHLPRSTQHLAADRLAQQPPVEEPPNQPQKPPVKEPPPKEPDREPPQNPPSPNGPPVKEPPNEPRQPPVKEPPPKDPNREPPVRAELTKATDERRVTKDARCYWNVEVEMGKTEN